MISYIICWLMIVLGYSVALAVFDPWSDIRNNVPWVAWWAGVTLIAHWSLVTFRWGLGA